jgi:hypothetical protein
MLNVVYKFNMDFKDQLQSAKSHRVQVKKTWSEFAVVQIYFPTLRVLTDRSPCRLLGGGNASTIFFCANGQEYA